jgi:tetratricopeptide (TPR) repeat protein
VYSRPAALVAALLALSTACSRQPAEPKLTRLAVLRFENVGPDVSTDWMGRAFSEVISAELASVPGISTIAPARLHALDRQTGVRPVSSPGISTERGEAILSGANRIGYGDYFVRSGKLYARLTLEDPATNRTVKILSVETPAGDVYGAATALARRLSPSAGAYATANPAALQAYTIASESQDPAVVSEGAARAVAADPNFGPAYRLLAAIKARRQDPAGALATLDAAAARGNAIPPAERARIALDSATLRNDQPARRQALIDLSKAEPQDLDVERSLAELSYALRDYPGSVAAYQKILAAEPDSVPNLNASAYANAYAGNLDAALANLHRYRTLLPNDVNAFDSTGDVYLISGRLAEAARAYLQAAQKNPNLQGGSDYFKAAMARLMAGDIAAADALEKQCEELPAIAHDPALPYRQAEWAWLTGRRKQGFQQLAAFAQGSTNKELTSRAYSELTLWSLLQGDRAGAMDMLRKAVQFVGPASAPTAGLMKMLVMPPEQAPVSLPLAYARLLNKQFDKAAAELQAAYKNPAASTDESLPFLYAWALIETGHTTEAAPLLRFNPVPPLTGPSLFMPMYFPRLYQLRARAGIDPQSNAALYQKLGGS